MVKRMHWHVHSVLGRCYDRPGAVQSAPSAPSDDLAKGTKYSSKTIVFLSIKKNKTIWSVSGPERSGRRMLA